MKMRIIVAVLALGAIFLLGIPTSQAQKGKSRVGWWEVCGPGPRFLADAMSGHTMPYQLARERMADASFT
jgi:hypothetical protein